MRKTRLLCFLLVWLACWAFGQGRTTNTYLLRVRSGDHLRQDSLVSFPLPAQHWGAKGLRDGSGNFIHLQVDEDGIATFIELYCQAKSKKVYEILYKRPKDHPTPSATAAQQGTKISLMSRRLSPIEYQGEAGPLPRKDIKPEYRRGGYFHRIFSPAKKLISDDYPPNHIHHHGIWFAWTKTSFEKNEPDFWNMGKKTGTVEYNGLLERWNGHVHSGFQSKHVHRELISPSRKIVLEETWDVRFYKSPENVPCYTVLDLKSTQVCATSSKLVLPEYHYGGLAYRGNRAWDGKENAFFLTSEGETDRVKGNESRARWCYMGGLVDGKQAGLVIMCHPSNYRAPQPLRLHPNEPYFCYNPQQLGEMEIAPDKPYISHYRMLVVDGPPKAAFIERVYNDYASPPEVELVTVPGSWKRGDRIQ